MLKFKKNSCLGLAFFLSFGVSQLALSKDKISNDTNHNISFKKNIDLDETVDYEGDLVRIYDYVLKHKQTMFNFKYRNGESINTDEKTKNLHLANIKAISKIKKATENKQMILKNITYQPDWESYGDNPKDCQSSTCESQIRVTWADKDNNMIVKSLYNLSTDDNPKTLTFKEDHFNGSIPKLDFVLEHGYYADKNKIDNIKFMYRESKKDEYFYFELDNLANINFADYNINQKTAKNYLSIQNKEQDISYLFKTLGEKHCQSCHEASPDLSKNKSDIFNKLRDHGAFFSRYQYKHDFKNVFPNLVFNNNDNALISVTKEAGQKLGFPEMTDSFDYQIIHVNSQNKLVNVKLKSDLATYDDFKTLYVNTFIIEIEALKRKKNYCVQIKKENDPKFMYICADVGYKSTVSNISGIDKNFNQQIPQITKY